MRQTLIEVLGEERGSSMYSMEWLVQRLSWHLHSAQVIGNVYVAEATEGEIVGHTIVRIDSDDDGNDIGLFSTLYVEPTARRSGVASLLLKRGERWMVERGQHEAVTYTDEDNTRLQALYIKHGYTLSAMPNQFVKLAKVL
ncbi:MAG: GNAT family N-acetyltransferase [Chloroflexi bacterium]|nr:GNAT family N-acetyltransferase [Chloroflexota bacterium]